MLKARKGNRVVRIPDEKAGEYKKLGYSLYNEKGEAVYLHVKESDRIKTLEKENAALKAANAQLTAEIQKLKDEAAGSQKGAKKTSTK